VQGMRGVIDRITLLPGNRSDAQIKAQIEEALLGNPAVDLHEVAIEVRDGRIRLTGTVPY